MQMKKACNFKLWPTRHCLSFLISQCTPCITLNNGTRLSLGLMAIYAEKLPEAIPHLAKHAEMVREMATSQNSNAWCVYDQRVIMDRQARGLPWEVCNIEFYIMATRARDSNFSGTFVTRDNTFLNCGCNRPFRGSFRPSFLQRG